MIRISDIPKMSECVYLSGEARARPSPGRFGNGAGCDALWAARAFRFTPLLCNISNRMFC
jgi:hypothetical protein